MRERSGVGRNLWWRGFRKKMVNYYNIWWLFLVVSKLSFLLMSQKFLNFLYCFFSRVQFLILSKNVQFLIKSNKKISKISHDLRHVQKIFFKFYINTSIFPYLLRQYLRILTHPIIHFLHFWHCIQFCSIYLKKNFSWDPMGGFNPQNPPLPTPLGC